MEWEQPYSPTPATPTASSTTSNGNSNGNGGTGGLRRRNLTIQTPPAYGNNSNNYQNHSSSSKKMNKSFRKLDLFTKVEQDLTVQSESNTCMTVLTYLLLFIILFAEIYNHCSINSTTIQHMKVDKSLDKKMRVDLNITFPALHCNDLHIDIMDIAGDAHNDVHDTMQKTRLHLDDGSVLSENEIRVLLNKAHEKEVDKLEAIDKSLIENYCGPCYGAQDSEMHCCNHCQDVLDAYDAKKWDYAGVKELAEQCVREGKTQPKKLDSGEGCRITGFMEFARVNGNFHIAMGDGVERNGQHIHAFLPDEVNKFNVSHVIHTLRFGPAYDEGGSTSKNMEQTSLDGVTKIVTKDNGVSGMFQYFIKIVPTAYKGKKIVQQLDPNFDMSKEPLLETNRYFVTERYTPTMEVEEGDWVLGLDFESDDDEIAYAASKVGGKTGLGHDTHEQHMKQRSILPGVFFIYQVYPFAVEISKKEVPLTHLLIRVMATIGGLFKILGWLESIICSTNKKRSQRNLR